MSLRIHSISSLSDLATLRKRKQSDNPTTARQTAKAVCRRGLSAAKADLKQNAIRGKRKAIMGCLVKRSQFLRGRNLGLKNAPCRILPPDRHLQTRQDRPGFGHCSPCSRLGRVRGSRGVWSRRCEVADHLGTTRSAVTQRMARAAREWDVFQGVARPS